MVWQRSSRAWLVVAFLLASLPVSRLASPALAAGETVTGPSDIRLRPNLAGQDPGDFVIAGFNASSTLLVSVGFVNPPTGTSFTIPASTARNALTPGYGYAPLNYNGTDNAPWTNITRISFTGTQANANTALASMLVSTGTTQGAVTIRVSAVPNQANTYYNPLTDRFYEFVSSSNITWTNSLAEAAARTLYGDTGYLVTITSSAENDFIKSNINAQKIWIAASDAGTEGDWKWVAGPENGQTFWKEPCVANGTGSSSSCGGSTGNSSYSPTSTPTVNTYSSWANSEPNNSDGSTGEDAAVTNWNAPGDGLWNDLRPSQTGASGYVAEFDGPFTGVASAQVTAVVEYSPRNLTTTVGDGQVTVTWDAPEVVTTTSYTVTANPGSRTCTVSGSSSTGNTCTVTGLTNGTSYTFTVTATHSSGSSSAVTSSVTPSSFAPTVSGPATASASVGAASSALGTYVISDPRSCGWTSVVATVTASSGTVATVAQGAASLSGNASGTLTITGTMADVTSTLGQVRVTPSAVGTTTVTTSVVPSTSFTIGGVTYSFNPANGHYYRVNGSVLSWENASAAAQAMRFCGSTGYLVTIVDAAEQTFLQDQVLNLTSSDLWMSGRLVSTTWRWQPGQNAPASDIDLATYAQSGTPWAPNEPNNSGSYMQVYRPNGTGAYGWDDTSNASTRASIVEFGSRTSFVASSTTTTVTVSAGNQSTLSITNAPTSLPYLGTRTLGTSGGSGGGSVTYASSNTAVCTVGQTSGVVTMQSGTGTCTITATKAADSNYNQTTATATFTATKLNQSALSITGSVSSLAHQQTVDLGTSGGSSSAAPSFATTTPSVCSVVSATGVVTMISGTGTCTITATRVGDDNYEDVSSTPVSISAVRASQSTVIISNSVSTLAYLGTVDLDASGGSGTGAYSFSAGASNACTVGFATGVVTMTSGTGTCTITATRDADSNFAAATAQVTITPAKIAQAAVSIANSVSTLAYLGTVDLDASGGSGTGAYSFSAGASNACSVVTNTGVLTMTSGTGTCTITATRAADDNHDVTSAQITITPAKIAQAAFSVGRSSSTAAFNGTATVSAAGGSGTGSVSWSTSGPCTIDTAVSPATITMTSGTGTCTVTATRAGDANHEQAVASNTITASRAPQSALTVSNPPSSLTYLGTATLSVSGGNGSGSVGFAVANGDACSVGSTSGQVTMNAGTGTCTVTATRAGDDNYTSTNVSITIVPAKATQSTLSAPSPSSAAFGETVNLAASGGSGTGSITYSHGASTACTVNSSGSVSVTAGSGTCTITIGRDGDANHLPATTISRILSIGLSAQTVSVADPGTVTFGATTITMSASVNTSNAVTWSSNTSSVCTIDPNSGALTTLAAGNCDVTATAAGTSTHGVGTGSRAFTVQPATLPTPQAVSIASIASTRIDATITPASNTTSYRVRLYRNSAVVVSIDLSSVTQSTPVSFENLDPSSTYSITVTAMPTNGNWAQSAESAATSATTPAAPAPSTTAPSDTTPPANTPTTTPTTAPVTTVPGAAAARTFPTVEGFQPPSIVTVEEGSALRQAVGQALAMIDGTPTAMDVTVLDVPAASIPPTSRTPEQVAELQAAARLIFDQFVASLPSGSESGLQFVPTATGVDVLGIVISPVTNQPVPIPFEDIVVLSGQNAGALVAALDDEYLPASTIGGSLNIVPGGMLAIRAYGFRAREAGEVAIFSTPRKLATFVADALGTINGQVMVPADLEVGDHTFVLASPSTKLSVGVTAAKRVRALPRTGDERSPLIPLALFLLSLGGTAVVYRRRPIPTALR